MVPSAESLCELARRWFWHGGPTNYLFSVLVGRLCVLFPRLVEENLRVLLLSVLPVTGPSHCLGSVDPPCAARTGETAKCLRAPAWPSFLI